MGAYENGTVTCKYVITVSGIAVYVMLVHQNAFLMRSSKTKNQSNHNGQLVQNNFFKETIDGRTTSSYF